MQASCQNRSEKGFVLKVCSEKSCEMDQGSGAEQRANELLDLDAILDAEAISGQRSACVFSDR
jgi:hypothetical protein